MHSWAAILLEVMQLGAKLLERLDQAAYDDFRRSLSVGDPVGVLGAQTGKPKLETVCARTEEPENRDS